MSVGSLRRRERIPYVIFLTALAVTAATVRYAHVSTARVDELRFEKTAEGVVGAISSRLDAYTAMLLGAAGLFAASDDVTRSDFRGYVARLELSRRYPGIQGIGFSRVVRAGERAAVLAATRREVPGFRFWPEQPEGDINAVLYLEPSDAPNQFALGFDMGSEGNRRDTMTRARDNGSPAATTRVRLVQEEVISVEQAGFLIYVPVYRGGGVPHSIEERRAQLQGFVYSPFRADDLFTGIRRSAVGSQIEFDVFDGPAEQGLVLYQARSNPATARFTVQRSIDFGGRSWTIVLHGEEDVQSSSQPAFALVAAGGTILSVLLFVVTRGEVVARTEAERTAEVLRISEEKLRAADQAKDEFLATISHELRTPLNAIVGWAAMLGKRAVPADLQAHAINVIARNAAAQTRLVEDLLDISRAVAGHLDLRISEIDTRLMLQAAVDAVQPQVVEAGLTLEIHIDPALGLIEADAGRFQQIVTNLLSNSIKFTPLGGRITLQAERTDETVVIAVSDTGIGIDEAFMPFLFDRFRQADSSSTRAHAGAGLGLAIARHLVHLHSGSLEGASAGIGKGSIFTVRLPVRQQRS